ncbi:TerC/Alx family metal homeostasis membrane protein [Kocuria sediminis]|uniref:TerC/Alx family metal homeostasis membrane protein n=1 Tax=Kocuria sediminis TaxID=1038857 RepID=A0A6N8GQD2_9MICC|nr:TerC family protein [Kocuria sediminis]MUN64500.1 TerC/Alx family metal homeostasis membrane protein [Kocuria sediminis]
MEVSLTVWIITIAAIVGLLLFDYVFHVRKAHEPQLKEAAIWSAIYVGLALLFGLFVLVEWGGRYAGEYYAGYITEKALSVDNLFVFLIIMASFKVPREDQQKVLLFGITFALVARTALIFVGAGLINQFAWVFYAFGLILLLTAGSLIKGELSESGHDEADNFVVRLAKRFIHTTDHYDGDKLFTIHNGKRAMTPMLLVMVAIGGTDVLFALDSIPAIFGLTQETYLVFTAVAFSLMGLRQLYFLIDGLLDRLIYLSWGLAIILGFIGVKLIIHALHENSLPFINNGEHVEVVEVSIGLSLSVIIGVLVITVLASLFSPKGRALRIIGGLQTTAEQYVTLPQDASPEERRKLADKAAKYQRQMPKISDKHREELVESEKYFHDLLDRARGKHREFERTGVGPEPDAVPTPEAEAVHGARADVQDAAGTTTPDTSRGGSTGRSS